MDKQVTDLQQSLNLLQYVADHRERYLEDCIQTVQKVFRRVPNLQQRCGKEVKHLEEIQD